MLGGLGTEPLAKISKRGFDSWKANGQIGIEKKESQNPTLRTCQREAWEWRLTPSEPQRGTGPVGKQTWRIGGKKCLKEQGSLEVCLGSCLVIWPPHHRHRAIIMSTSPSTHPQRLLNKIPETSWTSNVG
jgi:hypothetical protein